MVDYDEFNTDTVTEILKKGYSRMPVFKENTDNILGTVYIKDLFVEYAKNDYEFINLDNCIKSPYFVPETKKIDMLLKELQASKNYVGMVTVEDIVEEIVGEIEDEYDKENHSLEKISDNEYIVDGSMDIEDINDELGTSLYSENHETISGLIIEKLGFIPEENEKKKLSVKTSGCILTELAVADKRIVKASIKVIPEEQEEAKREYKEFNS